MEAVRFIHHIHLCVFICTSPQVWPSGQDHRAGLFEQREMCDGRRKRRNRQSLEDCGRIAACV